MAKQAVAEKLVNQRKKQGRSSEKKTTAKVDPVILSIGLLQKKFLLAFPKNPASKVPLKIGIHKDILEQGDQLGIDKVRLLKLGVEVSDIGSA